MGVAAVVAVLAATLLLVAYPLVRPPIMRLREGAGGIASRLQELEARKAALYGAIREVGFDLRTDKVTQEDYEHETAALKAQAVDIVTEIEQLRSAPPVGPAAIEAEIASARRAPSKPPGESAAASAFCTQCGQGVSVADRFCAACGHQLHEGP